MCCIVDEVDILYKEVIIEIELGVKFIVFYLCGVFVDYQFYWIIEKLKDQECEECDCQYDENGIVDVFDEKGEYEMFLIVILVVGFWVLKFVGWVCWDWLDS